MDLMGEKMRCPYDENHEVDPLRMPYHLMKCRKNFPNVQLAVCPYSALHEMPPIELQHHMANCPDKRLVEGVDPPHALLHALAGKEPNMLKGCTDIPPPVNVKFEGDDSENWDDDIGHDINQEHPSPHPLTHPRRRLHRNDGSNSLYPSQNTLPADFLVRRPISHSLAERLKPGTNCDPSFHDSTGEKQNHLGLDPVSDFETEKILFTQGDNLSICSPETTARPKSDISGDGSTHRIPEYITTRKDMTENKTNHRCIVQGRGRSSLLSTLDDSSRGDSWRPGFTKPQPFPAMGRGRFLSKIQADQ